MKADVLLQQITIIEKGTSLTECPGLVIINWMPPGEVQLANPGGRKLTLKNNSPIQWPDDYRDQFEMRATVTGKSWLEIQIIGMHDFGLLGVLIDELNDLAKKNWPFPLGSSLLDRISDDVKKGAPQVIASGRSDVIPADAIPCSVTINLAAPGDVLGEISNIDPITQMPTDKPNERKPLLQKGSPNGSITIKVVAA